MHTLRFRQVHLDFHTHGAIPGVGAKFDRRQFQDALQAGRVDSVTVFAKCHHGWSYHPTKVGRWHPTLTFDLLGEQIEACREIDVRCPIYISAGFDELMAEERPEWLIKNRDGITHPPLAARWHLMNFNSGYLDYLCRQIEEVVQRWPDHDGIFLDIIHATPDYSDRSLREMRELGLDPANPADVARHAQGVIRRYFERTTAIVRQARADAPIFHNSGHISLGADELLAFNSHLELESLPTGGWGYDHFPLSARYAITTGYDFLGMTGKFHTTWGEFGGFKRAAALRYECAAMLAYGAKCSVGDQLHPNGEMNPDTYALIGQAYAEVERKEPWCTGVQPVARIAIASAETPQDTLRRSTEASRADEGVARMLLELHQPFVVLDDQAAWKPYDVVVLPDAYRLTPKRLAKAKAYLNGGGRILAAGGALVDADGTRFALDPGAKLLGRSASDPCYLVANDESAEIAVRSPIVVHGGAWQVAPRRGTRVFAERREPYFNRTWEHFCSHQHAPDAPGEVAPGAIVNGRIAWLAHDIFTQYRQLGQPLYRDFVAVGLRHLLGRLPVQTTLPTGGRINVLHQRKERRFVVHLLHAITAVRGEFTKRDRAQAIELIEDIVPLHNVRVVVALPRRPKAVRLVPDGAALEFAREGDHVTFTVPRVEGHQMVELSY